MPLRSDVLAVLEETSRTFFLPISQLTGDLQSAIASAYLCMRAIDEIEDHPMLPAQIKVQQLLALSQLLQQQTSRASFAHTAFSAVFSDSVPAHGIPDGIRQPEVTIRLSEWACLAPESIAPRIWDATAAMADRMARWVDVGWKIRTVHDLDGYTFSVAGAVGLLVCDIAGWSDGFQLHREPAVHFGRGLQSVNIVRNRAADLARGVDFYPTGWSDADMIAYAHHYLALTEAYAQTMPPIPTAHFVKLPLLLANATLAALERGEEKLSRAAVIELLQQSTDDRQRTNT